MWLLVRGHVIAHDGASKCLRREERPADNNGLGCTARNVGVRRKKGPRCRLRSPPPRKPLLVRRFRWRAGASPTLMSPILVEVARKQTGLPPEGDRPVDGAPEGSSRTRILCGWKACCLDTQALQSVTNSGNLRLPNSGSSVGWHPVVCMVTVATFPFQAGAVVASPTSVRDPATTRDARGGSGHPRSARQASSDDVARGVPKPRFSI